MLFYNRAPFKGTMGLYNRAPFKGFRRVLGLWVLVLVPSTGFAGFIGIRNPYRTAVQVPSRNS